VLGPPDVYPQHGDLPGAWAFSTNYNGQQYIEVISIEEMLLAGSFLLKTLFNILVVNENRS